MEAKNNSRCSFSGLAFAALLPLTAGAALREMNTDRPDATESPFTVDAGHWQIETDLVSHTQDKADGVRTRTWDIAPFNLRYGVTNNFEAGIFVSPYTRVTADTPGFPRSTVSGVGDLVLRGKFNFFGNDGGDRALGLIVDLKLPTAANGLGNDAVEGDVILPVAFSLPGGWECGTMIALEFVERDSGGRGVNLINTVTLGHDLTEAVGFYVELTSAMGRGPHVATFDLGFTWKLDADTQLDTGANIGISRAADDLQVFAGVSRRF